MASPTVSVRPAPASTRRSVWWARRELERLDPVSEYERYAHLAVNVRLGDPPIAAALYTVAFIRQMAIPSIAHVVHRGGRSPIMTATRRRNDDGLFFFGEFMRHGPSSPMGAAAVERVRHIHTHFPITNEQQLFTLSSLMFEGELLAQVTGVRVLSERDTLANLHFWRAVGRGLQLTDMPTTVPDGVAWMRAYQAEHGGYTRGGADVAEAMLRDLELRVPAFARRSTRALALALCGPELRAHLRLPDPGRAAERALAAALRAYGAFVAVRPDPRDRAWSDTFRSETPAQPDYANVGYEPKSRSSDAPIVPADA